MENKNYFTLKVGKKGNKLEVFLLLEEKKHLLFAIKEGLYKSAKPNAIMSEADKVMIFNSYELGEGIYFFNESTKELQISPILSVERINNKLMIFAVSSEKIEKKLHLFSIEKAQIIEELKVESGEPLFELRRLESVVKNAEDVEGLYIVNMFEKILIPYSM